MSSACLYSLFKTRLNAGLKRRSNVVGAFPNPESVERLLRAVLMEQDEEWQAADQCYLLMDQEPQESAQTAMAAVVLGLH